MKPVFLPALLVLTVLAACSDYTAPSQPGPTGPVATTFAAVGDSATIAARLDQFRAALGGGLNAPNTPPQNGGRREINWDAVPAALTDVDNFPSSFFNVNSARGVVFTTPGTGFRVDDSNFASINADLGSQFRFFSTKKTFMPVGSRLMDVHFFLAGQAQFGLVNGFGVIFSDVDRKGSTRISFFDIDDQLLATYDAPARSGTKEFSFIGAVFPSSIVSRVRITSGDAALNGTVTDVSVGGANDLVVMDDFIYGEPRLTPQ